MTATKTASQRGKAARDKGAAFERFIANAIRPWFPDVRRSRDNGSATTADTGDLAGTNGGLFWSLKDDKAGDTGADGTIRGWLVETQLKAGANRTPLLVQKRRGCGDPLRSWCWLWLDDLALLLDAPADALPVYAGRTARLELGTVLALLAANGLARTPDPAGAA